MAKSKKINLETISDEELRKLLVEYGSASVGPITDTTRGVYKKRLAKLMDEKLQDFEPIKKPDISPVRSSPRSKFPNQSNTIITNNVSKMRLTSSFVSPTNQVYKNLSNRQSKEFHMKEMNSSMREKELPHNISKEQTKDDSSNPFPFSRSKYLTSNLQQVGKKTTIPTIYHKEPETVDAIYLDDYPNKSGSFYNSYKYDTPSKPNVKSRTMPESSTPYSSIRAKYTAQPTNYYRHYYQQNHENLFLKYFKTTTNVLQNLWLYLADITKPSHILKLLTLLFLIGSYLIVSNIIKKGLDVPNSQQSAPVKVSSVDKFVCKDGDNKCLNEQEHLMTMTIARWIYDLLATRAGKYECSLFEVPPKNYTTSDILLALQAKYPALSKFHLNNHLMSAINLMMANPHWGIEMADKAGNIYGTNSPTKSTTDGIESPKMLPTPYEIYWLTSNKPYIPTWCKLFKGLKFLLNRLFTLTLLTSILGLLGYGGFNFFKHKKRESDRVYQMVQKVLDIIQANDENFNQSPNTRRQSDGEGYPYIAISHVRDMLIPPNKRLELKWLWDKVVDHVSTHESRVRLETQMIHGEPFDVWRWLPASSVIFTNQTSTKTPLLTFLNTKRNARNNRGGDTNDDIDAGFQSANYLYPNLISPRTTPNYETSNSNWQGPAFEITDPLVTKGLTPCLKIRNLFDRTLEGSASPDWTDNIKDTILEKCGPNVNIVHMVVDHQSPEGCVYVKCATESDAGAAYKALHGWWYSGNLVAVKYIRSERYIERFPDSLTANAPLRPRHTARFF